jgi:hypothetical protein
MLKIVVQYLLNTNKEHCNTIFIAMKHCPIYKFVVKTFYSSRIQRVLTVVYMTQNNWGFGLCPSFGFVNNKITRVEMGGCFRLHLRRGR